MVESARLLSGYTLCVSRVRIPISPPVTDWPIMNSMRAAITALAVVCLGSVSFGQSAANFLSTRKANAVKAVTTPEELAEFSGTKVFELVGEVRGTIRSEDRNLLMFEIAPGESLAVEIPHFPGWLESGNGSRLRILAKVTKAGAQSLPEAKWIQGIPESMVASPAKPAPTPVRRTISSPSRTPSRSGTSRPAPMQGEITRMSNPENWTVSAREAVPIYAQYIRSVNKKLSSATATRIAEGIIGFSLEFDVDARLIVAMVFAESTFDPNSRSHAGAMGLGQLMPGTAQSLGVKNPYAIDQNLFGTVKYISGHIDKYTASTGDDFRGLAYALAAYNAGPGAVKKHGGIPPYRETQNYVRKVMDLYARLSGRN